MRQQGSLTNEHTEKDEYVSFGGFVVYVNGTASYSGPDGTYELPRSAGKYFLRRRYNEQPDPEDAAAFVRSVLADVLPNHVCSLVECNAMIPERRHYAAIERGFLAKYCSERCEHKDVYRRFWTRRGGRKLRYPASDA